MYVCACVHVCVCVCVNACSSVCICSGGSRGVSIVFVEIPFGQAMYTMYSMQMIITCGNPLCLQVHIETQAAAYRGVF